MQSWCILRTAGASTLPLTRTLSEAGFDAWAPVKLVPRRCRQGEKREDLREPLIPTFVFAGADRLLDLVTLASAPSLSYMAWDPEARRHVTRGHPYFSVFRHAGKYCLIPDEELEPLREVETELRNRKPGDAFSPDDEVRLTEGGFEGLRGVVHSVKGQYARVHFPGWGVPVNIPVGLLLPVDTAARVHIDGAQSEQAQIAKADRLRRGLAPQPALAGNPGSGGVPRNAR